MRDEAQNITEERGIKEVLLPALGLLPQNMVSFMVGAMVRLQMPAMIQRPLNKGFVSLFKINMGEAEKPLRDYKSIEDIFTRALLPKQRDVVGSYVSSADGVLEMSRPVTADDEAIQAKGITYSLRELVYGDLKASPLDAKWYTTVYLAPHNYHRVHAPFSGRVTSLRYVSGRLWPVNHPAVKAIPGLFCKNERLIFDFELEGGGKAWVVMVGAFNVGRMTTVLKPDFVTNSVGSLINFSSQTIEMNFQTLAAVSVGQELGTFMLGSTTVVILDSKACDSLTPREVKASEQVKVGQSLSR